MQKGKSKAASAAASQTPQPRLVMSMEAGELADNQEDGSGESSQLEREIDATTQLLEEFNVHAATWEALEVQLCPAGCIN